MKYIVKKNLKVSEQIKLYFLISNDVSPGSN